MVCIWEVESGKILYKVSYEHSISSEPSLKEIFQLPGHKGTVTAVDFHPKEPISAYMTYLVVYFCVLTVHVVVLTGGKDATMLLGELEPGMAL